jgi:hypothetical protein
MMRGSMSGAGGRLPQAVIHPRAAACSKRGGKKDLDKSSGQREYPRHPGS